MSNFGQAALTIGGAALGVVLPGVGWAIGATIGSMAGSALFPTDLGTVSGPRLNDLNVQSSAVGAPIPIVYGTYAIAGNVIWSSGLIEQVSRKRQGGKGGPTQTTKTYTYSVNCAVGICEGEIGGIRRIWADAKLIYDARPQLDGESAEDFAARLTANNELLANTEIYLGTAAQLADPTIESFEGAGNVSGFRDLAYVVFTEFQLADYGNRVPNFRFEVASAASSLETLIVEASGPVVHPWLGSNTDPRNSLNDHEYRVYNGLTDTYATAGGSYAATFSRLYTYHNAPGADRNNNPLVDAILGWSLQDGDNQQEPIGPFDFTDTYDAVDLHIWFAAGTPSGSFDQIASGSVTEVLADIGAAAGLVYHAGSVDAGTANHGIWYRGASGGLPAFNTPGSGPYYYPSVGLSIGEAAAQWNDESMVVRRLPSPPAGDGWELVSGTAKVLSEYSAAASPGDMGTYEARSVTFGGTIHNYEHQFRPNGTIRLPMDPEYSDSAWWTARYNEAVAADTAPSGKTYGVHYPTVVSEYYQRTVLDSSVLVDEGETTLGIIVADVCRRCGLASTQINVEDLTEYVDGYVITRVMTGRDAISPLRSYGWFDCVESEGVLKWPTRGKAAVFELTADDLAAHIAGDSRPSSVETDRQQEVELPRRLRVHYAQTEQNHEPGEQGASRLAAGDVEVRDLEVAVAMSDTKGARIADVVLYDLWWSRNRYRAIVDHAWLNLEPADAGTMPIDGRQERVRIVNVDHAMPGLLRLELVRDDDGVYQSYALGAPAAYAGTGGGSITTPGTAELILLDLPLLRDADNDAGYYAAVHSIGGTTWAGAAIFRSPDGGTTYEEVAATDEEASVGRLVSALASGPTTIIDEGNELFVDMDSGELESVSEASLLAGLNAAAIGADGRWEIIQFRDAVLSGSPNTWQLTGLLRGRRGTEWAVGSSQAGDKFVLLDSALMRIPMNVAAIGAERQHKAVLIGTSIDAATAVDFTGEGVALEPFSVVGVTGERSGGDLVISWIRRGRIGAELAGSGVDIPLSEETESYEIDIIVSGSPDVVRTLTSSVQSVTYTEAQQAADFGSPTPTDIAVRIYQMSATVGRGYPTEATL